MKPKRHKDCCKVKPESGGEKSRDCSANSEGNERQYRETLLADKNQNSNSSECQEAGHLSQALKKANFFTCECGAFDNKVIQQDLPCSKRDRVSYG